MKNKFNICLMFLAIFMFSACTTVNQTGRVGQSQSYYVHYGVIQSIKEVKVDNESEKNLGGLAGGVTGAALGSTIGKGSGNVVAIGLGAVAGVIAGAAIGNQINGSALEIIVKTDEGRTLSVIENPKVQLHVGQRVKVMIGSNHSRVEPY